MARNYMMRSEKRERMNPSARSDSRPRPRKRRRKGAGFIYKFFMMLLLLLLWPFGLLMLWRRKVRWSAGMKLLVSIVTLAACILIFGFALTVNTGNDRYTAIQDSANNFLDVSADWMVNAGHVVADKSVEVWNSASDLGSAALRRGTEVLPDALDKGVALAGEAKVKFVELANKVGWKLELPETEPDVTPEPAEALPGGDSEEAGGTLSALEKAEKVQVKTGDDKLPIYIPESAPDAASGKALTSGKLLRGLPTPTPEPTPVPTPEPTEEPEAEEPEAEPSGEPTPESTETSESDSIG